MRSELLQCHPAVSTGRTWHSPHYHPYSRSHRNIHHLQNPPAYIPSSNMSYPGWHNEVDYSGLSASTRGVPWNSHNYITPFAMYDTEDSGSYAAQPPSYMLPDPDHSFNQGIYSASSLPRAQQGGSWPVQISSTSTTNASGRYARSNYTMASGPMAKSYTLIPLSTSFSTDRHLPGTSIHSTISAIPTSIDDRSPISAASHRSSHTWNTETTTSTGNLSSQTSCGDIHDISGTHRDGTSADQVVPYPYITHRDSPQISASTADLSTTREVADSQPLLNLSDALRSAPGTAYTDAELADFQNAQSRENFRTTSPSLYGYASRNRNLYYDVMPKRTMGDNASYHWHNTPTSTSMQSDVSLGEQQNQGHQSVDMGQYPMIGSAATSLIPSSTY